MDARIKPPVPGTERHRIEMTLSPRELEVMEHYGDGMSTTEAAAAMGLSVKTVSTYGSRILEKLGIESQAKLRVAAANYVRELTSGNR